MNRHHPCLIQTEDTDAGLYHVQVTETPAGIDLRRWICPEDPEEEDWVEWGKLSLHAWQTLCEMFALRHPDRFEPVVRKWQALRESQALKEK